MVSYRLEILFLLSKTLQTIQLHKTEIIKLKWQWQKILKIQYRFKIHNTLLSRRIFTQKLFWPKSTILISKSAKVSTSNFKVEIGLSTDLINWLTLISFFFVNYVKPFLSTVNKCTITIVIIILMPKVSWKDIFAAFQQIVLEIKLTFMKKTLHLVQTLCSTAKPDNFKQFI